MEFPYRKRQRIPASCSVCRKRKSKCDRIKPICGSCKKKSIAHLCYYESDKVELSPNDTNSMNYGGMGPIKANSPGEPTQIGHPFPGTNGVQGSYQYGPNGEPVNNEGFIPPILQYVCSWQCTKCVRPFVCCGKCFSNEPLNNIIIINKNLKVNRILRVNIKYTNRYINHINDINHSPERHQSNSSRNATTTTTTTAAAADTTAITPTTAAAIFS